MSVSRSLLECLIRLRNLDEFKAFREYLQTEMQQHVDRLTMSNDDRQMVLAQGSVRVLRELTDLIEQSASLLDKERRS